MFKCTSNLLHLKWVGKLVRLVQNGTSTSMVLFVVHLRYEINKACLLGSLLRLGSLLVLLDFKACDYGTFEFV